MKHDEKEHFPNENEAIKALAAASKSPFWTAFKIALGLGLARLALLTVGGIVLLLILSIVSNLMSK